VLVDEDDRHLHLILWREDKSQSIWHSKQQLLQVLDVYGSQGKNNSDNLIKTITQNDFYVDDLITGSNDKE
ncbi:hypothetical protein EVAR_69528_1, partial [Eumeta japonica]